MHHLLSTPDRLTHKHISLTALIVLLMSAHLISCGPKMRGDHAAISSSTRSLKVSALPRDEAAAQRVQESRKLYMIEGQRSAPRDCAELNDPQATEVLMRYFAYTQGNKAIVKEHCESGDLLELPELKAGECVGKGCRYHDTYRRGPTYFARVLAAFEAQSPSAEVEIRSLNSTLDSDGSADDAHFSDKAGLFNLTQHQEVQRQRLRFKLDLQTRCVAQLKIFREDQRRDRADDVKLKRAEVSLPARIGLGDIWAEHRRTPQGYELLILERQLARSRGEGEVLEVELLCQNPREQIDPHRSFVLSAQEVSRDTLRVFARPR